MALTISQIVASSYNAVLAAARKPENQWAESAAMREFEKQGFIDRVNFGPTLEAPLDWRRNPGAGFMATDLEAQSMAKTDVISAASYAIAQLSVPVVWSKMDDATNPSENQKIALVKSLLQNSIDSHDDLIEEALFGATTNNFLGLQTLIPDAGQGTVGGIDASTETMWRNANGTYTGASDIVATFTTVWNAVSKGSGSALSPKLLISGSAPHATYEGTQQSLQRYIDKDEADAGFKILAFKTARYVFSQFGGTRIFMVNPKSFGLKVSKAYFRDRSETQELVQQGVQGFACNLYSALQMITNNKSRCGVVHL